MGLFNSDVIDKAAMKLIEPIGNLKADFSYVIYLYKDHIQIKDVLTRKDAQLSLEQITNVFYGTETEIIEKSKSVVGRALVGSLFSPVGTIVGAISGTGTKKKKVNHTYLIITYTSKEGHESSIKFEDTFLDGRRFSKKLNELIMSSDNNHAIL